MPEARPGPVTRVTSRDFSDSKPRSCHGLRRRGRLELELELEPGLAQPGLRVGVRVRAGGFKCFTVKSGLSSGSTVTVADWPAGGPPAPDQPPSQCQGGTNSMMPAAPSPCRRRRRVGIQAAAPGSPGHRGRAAGPGSGVPLSGCHGHPGRHAGVIMIVPRTRDGRGPAHSLTVTLTRSSHELPLPASKSELPDHCRARA